MPNSLTVAIPTFRRPNDLKRALSSVMAQLGMDRTRLEILVVDNDPQASARELITNWPQEDVPVRYVHEPEPGVANVRNRIIAEVTTDLVAFLDDDQSAPAIWLRTLLKTHKAFPAPVTFGPVTTKLPEEDMEHEAYLRSFFERKGPDDEGLSDTFYGCGNSLFDMRLMPAERPLFDVSMNETGGEDDLLFLKLKTAGHQFAWSPGAWVFEHVSEERARLRYTLKRAFAYGQSPSVFCLKKSPTDWFGLAYWCMVGVGQSLVFGMIAVALLIARSPSRARYFDKFVQGLGKFLWFGAFDLKFYGRSALEAAPQAGNRPSSAAIQGHSGLAGTGS